MNDDEDYTFTIDTTATSTSNITIGSNITVGMETITGFDTTNYSSSTGNATVTIDATDYTYSNILDNMIDIAEVEDMCEKYPALKTAYEKFKTVYKMVEQDYKGKYYE